MMELREAVSALIFAAWLSDFFGIGRLIVSDLKLDVEVEAGTREPIEREGLF